MIAMIISKLLRRRGARRSIPGFTYPNVPAANILPSSSPWLMQYYNAAAQPLTATSGNPGLKKEKQ